MWNEERSKLENELAKLSVFNVNNKNEEQNIEDKSIPIRTINYRVTKISNEIDGIPELKQKINVLKKKVKPL